MMINFLLLKISVVFIVLSYDDGPTIYTQDVIKELKNNNLSAIFFPIICQDANRKILVKQLIDSGFILGNHTFCHTELRKNVSNREIEKAIVSQHLLLKEFQENIEVFRFPSGIYNNKAIPILQRLNYKQILFWDVSTYKSTKWGSVDRQLKRLIPKKQTIVVLLHDIGKNSIEITKNIIHLYHNQWFYINNIFYFVYVAHPSILKKGSCHEHNICIPISASDERRVVH